MRSQVLLVAIILGLFALPSVLGHGRLVKPAPRGKYSGKYDYQENAPVVSRPLTSEFVCRNDPAPSQDKWVRVQAGKNVTMQWELTAAHVGDCAVYISYDADKPDTQKQFFKIANIYDCKSYNKQPFEITIPSYLPPCDHCILRWEWYALHVRPTIEFYTQCADIIIDGNANGGLPSPRVTIPGHLPEDGNQYRNGYELDTPQFITGPAIATYNGAGSTTGRVTTGSATTGPATTGRVTTGSATTGAATTGRVTTGSATTGSASSTTGSNPAPGQCLAGTKICKSTPESSAASYQCCAPGAECYNSGDSGVCCGPSTAGCVYGSAGNMKSACCDTRYLRCDATQGCVSK